jgi:hypothetical protein
MPKNYQNNLSSEWSAMVEIGKLGVEPKTFKIEASEEERADLARRYGIVSVDRALAIVTLQKTRGNMIHALGTLQAEVTQSCVVSLEPVTQTIEEEFEGWFGDDDSAVSFARAKSERDAAKSGMETEILEESVDPEPIVNGQVDIGELAAQHLSLSLDPYPHAPGVTHALAVDTHEESVKGGEGANLRKNPFEALKDWKEKR